MLPAQRETPLNAEGLHFCHEVPYSRTEYLKTHHCVSDINSLSENEIFLNDLKGEEGRHLKIFQSLEISVLEDKKL